MDLHAYIKARRIVTFFDILVCLSPLSSDVSPWPSLRLAIGWPWHWP